MFDKVFIISHKYWVSVLPLWKRYRALAAGTRIDILLLLKNEAECCVKEVAVRLDIAEDLASRHLMTLSSAGWVSKRPAGRYLYYKLDQGNELLDEVLTFAEEKGIERLIFAITALTHERRIVIAKVLTKAPMRFDSLCRKTRIPSMALRRHLDKLKRRGFVQVEERRWMLVIPDGVLGKKLIDSALKDITPVQV